MCEYCARYRLKSHSQSETQTRNISDVYPGATTQVLVCGCVDGVCGFVGVLGIMLCQYYTGNRLRPHSDSSIVSLTMNGAFFWSHLVGVWVCWYIDSVGGLVSV